MVLSLVMLVYCASHPVGAVVGQLPRTEAYRDVRQHPEAITFPGLLIWRIGGDLFFASVGRFDDDLKAAMTASPTPVGQVLLDASAVTYVDASACDALRTLVAEPHRDAVAVAFAHVQDPVRNRLRLGGVEALVGTANFYERVTDGLRAWEAGKARPAVADAP